jgi:hypothetical protein
MPIRFACPHCSQKLSVSTRRAGASVDCPRCRRELTIPTPEKLPAAGEPRKSPAAAAATQAGAASEGESAEPDERDVFAQFVFDDDDEMELVYDTSEPAAASPAAAATVDYDRISVPRRVLYLQGGLLGVVGLVCFTIGLIAGSGFFSAPQPAASKPCIVSGAVTYTAAGRLTPDEGAVVVALPQSREPEERASISGLRPSDPPPAGMQRGIEIIRTIGGAYTRADANGRYQLRLPTQGKYFLLVISRGAEAASLDHIQTEHLLKLGRFFDMPADLLGKQKYQWTAASLHGDMKLNAEF